MGGDCEGTKGNVCEGSMGGDWEGIKGNVRAVGQYGRGL